MRQCKDAADVAFSKSKLGSTKNLLPADSIVRHKAESACSVCVSWALAQPIASNTAKCSLGGKGGLFALIA